MVTFRENCRYFIVIDGLDECKSVELQQVFNYLKNLLKLPNANIKCYYSCRGSGIIWPPLITTRWQILIDPHDIDADINHYIQVTLEQKLEDESLRLGDPRIILAIQKALMEKAQGMLVILLKF